VRAESVAVDVVVVDDVVAAAGFAMFVMIEICFHRSSSTFALQQLHTNQAHWWHNQYPPL
jgi:siroheme synthase